MASLFLVQPAKSDDAARQDALDLSRSFLVEAPAGSGKTGLLMQRYLKLLAGDSVTDPAQILAITFTKKATAELRERVLFQLRAALQERDVTSSFARQTQALATLVIARDNALGWKLLTDPYRLNIRTIDSLCAQIATALPVLSGGGTGLSPVLDAGPLYREAARKTLMLLGGPDRALHQAIEALLLHRDGNLAECEKLLAQMLEWRDQWSVLLPNDTYNEAILDHEVRPKFERALELAVCRTLTQLNEVMPPELAHELAMLAKEMSSSPGYDGKQSPINICRELHSAPGQAAKDLDYWRALAALVIKDSGGWRKGFNVDHVKFTTNAKDRGELKKLVELLSATPELCASLCRVLNLPPLTYPEDQWLMVKIFFRILTRAQEELQQVFARRGQCDFTEISLLARQALQQSNAAGGLRTAIGYIPQHLLIDEMQDTSNSQYELLQLLTKGWDGTSRTVFLVGDPRQSIYRFRQARVERFIRAKQDARFGDISLQTLQLTANFRSQPDLVDDFNANFSTIFPDRTNDAQPEEVPYVRADAKRQDSDGDGWIWHPGFIPNTFKGEACSAAKQDQALEDACNIRQIVTKWRGKPLPPGRTKPWSVAILVRSRNHLVEIVRAFKQDAPIPFRAIEIDSLNDRQEVLDAVALTRALLHPADRVAWFAVLRAPWCGLTLADLHRLAGMDQDGFAKRSIANLITERGHELSEDGCARLIRIWPVLQAAAASRGRSRIAEWIERTWCSLGATVAYTGDQSTNVHRYFELLAHLEQPGGRLNLDTLDQQLKKLYAATSLESGAVDLMTIHRAKGLEWDVVIVPELHRITQNDTPRLLTWIELDNNGDDRIASGVLAPIAGKGEENQRLNKWIRSVDTARERAEQKRLLYVASTRAREELHLFAAPEQRTDGSLSTPESTLLQSAWPAAQRHFEEAARIAPPILSATLDLAASSPALISRAFPLVRFTGNLPSLAHPAQALPNTPENRPQGSFAARCFGNVTHELIELLTRRAQAGITREALSQDLPTWNRRAATLLRAAGVAPALAEKQGARITNALSGMVRDDHGWWLLSPHGKGALSESSITSWTEQDRRSLRADRIFYAGPVPLSRGEDFLWIVDYKTGSSGSGAIEPYLAREKENYAPQLETYATAFAPSDTPVRLALYHPILARLTWWESD